jgi:hypothetical protein
MVHNKNYSYWPRTIWSTTTTTVIGREPYGPQQQLQLLAENHRQQEQLQLLTENHMVHNINYSYWPRTIWSTTTTTVINREPYGPQQKL